MKAFRPFVVIPWLLVGGLNPGCLEPTPSPNAPPSSRYEDLVSLFQQWREFQKPPLVDGVPDYGASAMASQRRELAEYQGRLAKIDPSGWPISQQVDYHLVRAELNGLEFDHRVLQPWANNPAFYVTLFPSESDQPAREGPHAEGAVELWQYEFPLSSEDAAELAARIDAVPGLLEQAQQNLTGNGKDLWEYGTKSIEEQGADLRELSSRTGDASSELAASIGRAIEATDAFARWLHAEAPKKTDPSGVGVKNYDWYLQNVQLVPYSWQDEVLLMERELARSRAFLALEEARNAGLPVQEPIGSAEEYERRFAEAVTEYIVFLRDREILSLRDYMEPALRARMGRFNPGPREFFTHVDHRDPLVMRTHGYHWFDKAWLEHEGHASPIRQATLLYNIFATRTEGLATAWEEMMLQAGMFDSRPRSRELIYILVAQRAARALGDLRMHGGELTLEQAAEFTSAATPRGWLSLEGNLVRGEQHLYLQQPGYGTSYLIGKLEIEKLLAERKRRMGGDFTLRKFMDELNAAGLVPASLLRWELTGALPDDVRRMLDL